MDAIDALLWGYQIKKLRHFRMHHETIGNFSPSLSQLSNLLSLSFKSPLAPSTYTFSLDSSFDLVLTNQDGVIVLKLLDQGNRFVLDPTDFGLVSVLSNSGSGSGLQVQNGRIINYAPRGIGISALGAGVPSILGLDNRSGITAADGAPITIYPVPVGANQLFDAAIEIDATAFTSGTATYTMTYTENGVAQTIVVTATVLNVVTGVRRLIQPDASTLITVQLTGAFVATVRLSAAVMQLA